MAMFDWYEPARELRCPIDDELLTGWQGGDAWIEEGGGETRSTDRLARMTLPSTFRIYTRCPLGHIIYAIGAAHDGVWYSTEIASEADPQQVE